ncbi:MAG: ATP-dependent DNA helicase RecG [Chloroflexota bacterium]
MTDNAAPGELAYLKGVGPRRAEALMKAGIQSWRDLIFYFPRNYISRTGALGIQQLINKKLNENAESALSDAGYSLREELSVVGKIIQINERNFGRNRSMLELILTDDTGGKCKIVFWNMVKFFKKLYNEGQLLAVSGKGEVTGFKTLEFTHPEIDIIDEDDAELYKEGLILPNYTLTEEMRKSGLNMRLMRQLVAKIVENYAPRIKETLPDYILKRHALPDIKITLKSLHFPENMEEVKRAQRRVKFEEVFQLQLILSLDRNAYKTKERAPVFVEKSPLARELYSTLPFKLTGDQLKALRDITADFRSGSPMNRLLQGDVGSGKTIVALLSTLIAIDSGYQVAFMAPTEILAEQHYATIQKFFEGFGLSIVQLVGGQRKKLREEVIASVSSGTANIVVGTHALFSGEIPYKNLGFVVIDEQHRFGVEQRADLIRLSKRSMENGFAPHILLMTATPIPRTMTMTVYGDLDVSVIKEMPRDRKPIKTKVAYEKDRDEVLEFVKDKLREGRQAYIVYPLVEKSEKLELKAATEHFEELRTEAFGEFSCGLLHGQMQSVDKESVMRDFLAKRYDVLVATTVIEVGIDVANATVMIIEDAERFGLSQLHQLRGRVGRGSEQSYCVLLTKDKHQYQIRRKNADDTDIKALFVRLKTMEETTDGFKIAEIDLKLRGPGDMLGTRQSGLPLFKYVDLAADADIIAEANELAKKIVERDPKLEAAPNKLLKDRISDSIGDALKYYRIA